MSQGTNFVVNYETCNKASILQHGKSTVMSFKLCLEKPTRKRRPIEVSSDLNLKF